MTLMACLHLSYVVSRSRNKANGLLPSLYPYVFISSVTLLWFKLNKFRLTSGHLKTMGNRKYDGFAVSFFFALSSLQMDELTAW